MNPATPKDPYQPVDDEARALTRSLIDSALHATLGVLDPTTQTPVVTRIALVSGPDRAPLGLVSDLSPHTAALRADDRCSLLIGEPEAKGDPLTHPRLTIQARATLIGRGDAAHPALATHFVARQPKAKLYIGFADFSLVRFKPQEAFLNAGFGKAYRLARSDLSFVG